MLVKSYIILIPHNSLRLFRASLLYADDVVCIAIARGLYPFSAISHASSLEVWLVKDLMAHDCFAG